MIEHSLIDLNARLVLLVPQTPEVTRYVVDASEGVVVLYHGNAPIRTVSVSQFNKWFEVN